MEGDVSHMCLVPVFVIFEISYQILLINIDIFFRIMSKTSYFQIFQEEFFMCYSKQSFPKTHGRCKKCKLQTNLALKNH